MAITYIGEIALSKLLHQPESAFSISRDGTVRAVEVYNCRTDDMVRFAYQIYRAPHPTISYIGVDDVQAQEEEGGISRLVIKYAGFDTAGNASTGGKVETFSERQAVRAEPVDTFKTFVAMPDADRTAFVVAKKQFDDNGAYPEWFSFDPETQLPANVKSARFNYYIRGVESFYEPAVEFTRRTVFNSRSGFRLNQSLGKIDVPPAQAPKYTGRNWLFKGREQTTEGFATTIDEVWELSGPLGWDPYFYKTQA